MSEKALYANGTSTSNRFAKDLPAAPQPGMYIPGPGSNGNAIHLPLGQEPLGKKVIQPQPHPGMYIQPPGGDRNVKNLPVNSDGREWSHGLCDCCGSCGIFGNWCFALWCCCVQYSRNQRRLRYLTIQGVPDPRNGGSFCSGDGCWYCCCGPLLLISMRGGIRQRYSIAGGGCGDCCVSLYCSSCTLTQQSRELKLEERSFDDKVSNSVGKGGNLKMAHN